VLIDEKDLREVLVLKGQQEIKTRFAEYRAVTPQNSPPPMLCIGTGALARTGRGVMMAKQGWPENGGDLLDGHTVPKRGNASLGDLAAAP